MIVVDPGRRKLTENALSPQMPMEYLRIGAAATSPSAFARWVSQAANFAGVRDLAGISLVNFQCINGAVAAPRQRAQRGPARSGVGSAAVNM